MDLGNVFNKIDAISPTDFTAQARIANEHWVEIINKNNIESYQEFSEFTIICAILGHALVELREKKKALQLITHNLDIYDQFSSEFNVSLSDDLFYDKVLFDKVVCLSWLGRQEESAKTLTKLRELKPDDDNYKKWEQTVSINKLFYLEKVLTILAYCLIALELVLRYIYNIKPHGVYIIIAFIFLGIGYILKKKGLKKKESI